MIDLLSRHGKGMGHVEELLAQLLGFPFEGAPYSTGDVEHFIGRDRLVLVAIAAKYEQKLLPVLENNARVL